MITQSSSGSSWFSNSSPKLLTTLVSCLNLQSLYTFSASLYCCFLKQAVVSSAC